MEYRVIKENYGMELIVTDDRFPGIELSFDVDTEMGACIYLSWTIDMEGDTPDVFDQVREQLKAETIRNEFIATVFQEWSLKGTFDQEFFSDDHVMSIDLDEESSDTLTRLCLNYKPKEDEQKEVFD